MAGRAGFPLSVAGHYLPGGKHQLAAEANGEECVERGDGKEEAASDKEASMAADEDLLE